MDYRDYLISANEWKNSIPETIWWKVHKNAINLVNMDKNDLFKNLNTGNYHVTTAKTNFMITNHQYVACVIKLRHRITNKV
jgi:hypothetical protein